MRRTEIAPGGDCGGEASSRCVDRGIRKTSWTAGAIPDSPAWAVITGCALVGIPLKCPRTGRSLWQQPCAAGIAAFPQSADMCLQHAISAGVIRAPGRAQAIAGAMRGKHTAMIKANWRRTFIPGYQSDGTSNRAQSPDFLLETDKDTCGLQAEGRMFRAVSRRHVKGGLGGLGLIQGRWTFGDWYLKI